MIRPRTLARTQLANFLLVFWTPGEVSFAIAYDPEDTQGQSFLKASLRSRTEQSFRIVSKTTNNAFRKFDGYVMSFEPKDPVEGIIEADFAIKVTGQISEGTVQTIKNFSNV